MSNGVLIFDGMTVGILPGDLKISINEHGEFNSDPLILSTAYNVIPIWLRIAKDNLNTAKIAYDELLKNWNQDPKSQKALLISELMPSMQVIVACGIALDALYETLRPHSKITDQDIQRWKTKRTGRGAQIFEVIQRSFRLNNDIGKKIRESIIQIIKFRDMAVHPSLELKRSVLREDVSVGVDWKFFVFRYQNAKNAFESTYSIFLYLYQSKKTASQIDEAMKNIFLALEELKVVQKNPSI